MFSAASIRSSKIDGMAIACFVTFAILGLFLVAYPLAAFGVILVSLGVAVVLRLRSTGLELWQVLLLATLLAYIVLNYGFDNVAFKVGSIPVILGSALVLAALTAAVLGNSRGVLIKVSTDPSLLCLVALLILSALHLVRDVNHYGIYALRDSAMFVEGPVLLLLGLSCGTDKRLTKILMKGLLFLFMVNLIYSFSLPWADHLKSWSPTSGVFLTVPVLGSYQHVSLYLAAGALFYIWLGTSIVSWPRWVLVALAVAQLCGLALTQSRSSYVGIAVVLILLLLLGESQKWAQLIRTIGLALGALLSVTLLISSGGFNVTGRAGPVDSSFLKDRVGSVFSLTDESSRSGTDSDRFGWYNEVWERNRTRTKYLLAGRGFGEPLIDFRDKDGVAVREPHNASLSVFGRLGLSGLALWLLFHILVLRRFLRAQRMRPYLDAKSSSFALWLFLFYVLSMIVASVQPLLQFSHGAVPFYFLLGFTLGFIRWQIPEYADRRALQQHGVTL